jgi:hypothetical protein
MSAIAAIKLSSILGGTIRTTSATAGIDVSSAGSPGNLDPEGFTPTGVAKWVDRSSGYQIGYPSFTLSCRAPTKTSRVTRIQAKYVSPTLEVTSPSTATGIQPAPTKAYECTFNGEFLIPERATLAERTAFFSRVLSLFMTTINASDDVPTDATGSPLPGAVITLDKPY